MIRLERLAFWFDLMVSSVKLADKLRNRNLRSSFFVNLWWDFRRKIPCVALTGQDIAYTTVVDCTLDFLA